MALNAYRHLLRAAGVAFKGDNVRLRAARQEARKGFEIGRSLAPGTEEHSHQVLYAEEVAKVLRENVVQGEFGNEGRYKLNIHKDTERGDNASIKQAPGRKNTLAGLTGGSCAS